MTDQVLLDTAQRLFRDYCNKDSWDAAERGEFPEALWQALQDNGFAEMALPDSGFELGDLFAVLRIAGAHAAPLPLAEYLLGARWLGRSGERVSVGFSDAVSGVAARTVQQVPWGRCADWVLALPAEMNSVQAQDLMAPVSMDCIRPTTTATAAGVNLTGEARDDIAGESVEAINVEAAYALLALARAVQMSGCMSTILELALTYATEREQFGRSISKFQAIQHNLAVAAAEVAAAQRASDSAVAALGSERFLLDLAAAKARVGEAAGIVAEIAHQVHGAMGFTHEHQLHHFTRRLWAWRDEYGNEAEWQQLLGNAVAKAGADQAWGLIATRA
ncbi:MAG: acyl-CoA dehydrogenase family protein [Pseudomonadales bacterium]